MTISKRGGTVLTAGLAVSVGMFAFGGGPTAEAATVLAFSPLPHRMHTALQGSVCASPNTCTDVDYSVFLPVSLQHITTAIDKATEAASQPGADPHVIVFGLSGGAGSASNWMREHDDDVDKPSPDVLSFVFVGNPNRKYGGSSRLFATLPDTPYHVIDIAQQYDPIADSPDNPYNLLAALNIAAGLLSPLHTDYSKVNIDDPNNIRWTEGNTTYILIPTEKLPLLAPLRAFGFGALADKLNAPLKAIIERAYNRPAPQTPPVEPPVDPPVDPPVVPDPPLLAARTLDVSAAERDGNDAADVTITPSIAQASPQDDAATPVVDPDRSTGAVGDENISEGADEDAAPTPDTDSVPAVKVRGAPATTTRRDHASEDSEARTGAAHETDRDGSTGDNGSDAGSNAA